MNPYFELVRLPAVLSTPGDTLLGAAASGDVRPVRAVGLTISSALLYASGMALNDYADREVDAVERPNRPIPSGRISAARALAVGGGLMAAGIGVATLVDGKRGLVKSSAVAGAVVAYDFVAKGTPAGPPVMASCRFLDVMLGASSTTSALVPATVVAAHTFAITGVSAYEVEGGTKTVGKMSAAATAAIAAAALLSGARKDENGSVRCISTRSKVSAVATAVSAAVYAAPSIAASKAAIADPAPQRLQKIVGTGVMGMIPLQGVLINAKGRTLLGAAVTALWPVGRTLAKRRRVT